MPDTDNGASGGLIMIDTTKTTKQKLKEAAAARRNEKAMQKAAKLAAKSTAALAKAANRMEETSEGINALSRSRHEQSLAESAGAGLLPPSSATYNENSADPLIKVATVQGKSSSRKKGGNAGGAQTGSKRSRRQAALGTDDDARVGAESLTIN